MMPHRFGPGGRYVWEPDPQPAPITVTILVCGRCGAETTWEVDERGSMRGNVRDLLPNCQEGGLHDWHYAHDASDGAVVLARAGLLDERRWRLLVASATKGDDPVAFAHHLVRLVRAFNQEKR